MFPSRTTTPLQAYRVSGSIITGPGRHFDSVNTQRGRIEVGPRARVGSVNTISGDVLIRTESEVKSVANVCGNVKLVGGSNVCYLMMGRGCLTVADHSSILQKLECKGSTIVIDDDVAIRGRITSIGSKIVVGNGSKLMQGVVIHNGLLSLKGSEVRQGIKGFFSDVIVGAGSLVNGGINVCGPTEDGASVPVGEISGRNLPTNPRLARDQQTACYVEIGPGAQVVGAIRFIGRVALYVHETAQVGEIVGAVPVVFSTSRPEPKPAPEVLLGPPVA